MQYEPTLSRDELIDIATIKYFGNVDAKSIDAAMECFNDEAMLCVQTEYTRHAGKTAIRRMLEDFTAAYATIVHKDFTCTVDETNGRVTASFEAVLTGHDGAVTRLYNTNFWRFRDGKFQEVYVYFSGANVLV